jgi:hypothetical protein
MRLEPKTPTFECVETVHALYHTVTVIGHQTAYFFYFFFTPWSESESELYRPSDSRLSAKLAPTFEDSGCHVVRVTDRYGRILVFLDRIKAYEI